MLRVMPIPINQSKPGGPQTVGPPTKTFSCGEEACLPPPRSRPAPAHRRRVAMAAAAAGP